MTAFPMTAIADPPRHLALVRRLNEASVKKHFDAYTDIEWDAPENRIDVEDPRFERPADMGLGATEWYRAQPQAIRARLGLHLAMEQMRLGIDFETVLTQGLLELAFVSEPGSPELRYAYHEVIEECQHSLMFQEMIARAALPVRGLSPTERALARRVPPMARAFPELFFMRVLAGEAPIDFAQKAELRRNRDTVHPLLRRIVQIHVMEEARHISFATSFLNERVPKLSALKRLRLQIETPITLGLMTHQMLEPPRWLLDAYSVPKAVRREAFVLDEAHRSALCLSVAPLRALMVELGVATPAFAPLWRAFGIWDQSAALLDRGAARPQARALPAAVSSGG